MFHYFYKKYSIFHQNDASLVKGVMIMYSHKTLYLKTFEISCCILNVMFEFCV